MRPNAQIQELLLQALEHELGGVQVYTTAIQCAVNDDLKKEWQRYLAETRKHVSALEELTGQLGIDNRRDTPGRKVVRHLGESLVEAMNMAKSAGNPQNAQLVACECVVLAETKDHQNWVLIGMCARELEGAAREALDSAYRQFEDQEDEHLYHSRGWCRELWIQSLGLQAVLPPPEERRHVKTAIGAAKAEAAADKQRLGLEER